jgi:hypothetical protein
MILKRYYLGSLARASSRIAASVLRGRGVGGGRDLVGGYEARAAIPPGAWPACSAGACEAAPAGGGS